MTAPQTMVELADELRQRAIDFRKNASGADDRDQRVDNAIAAILDDYAKDLSARSPPVSGGTSDGVSRISDTVLALWKEMARRDDWHMKFVGSDIRLMIQEIERLRSLSRPERDGTERIEKGQ